MLCQSCNSDDRLQIVIEGTVNIYHIRDDGSKYFIAMNEGIYLLGDMEFMNPAPCIYFVEAVSPVTVAVLSLKKYRNVLKQDVKFMNLIASTLAAKLGIAANGESVSASLKDRILNHLEDEKIVAKCGKGTYWLLCLRKDVSLPLTGDNMNTTKKSLKDRIRDYLIKNINYIVPGILMLGGSIYYPENYRRH